MPRHHLLGRAFDVGILDAPARKPPRTGGKQPVEPARSVPPPTWRYSRGRRREAKADGGVRSCQDAQEELYRSNSFRVSCPVPDRHVPPERGPLLGPGQAAGGRAIMALIQCGFGPAHASVRMRSSPPRGGRDGGGLPRARRPAGARRGGWKVLSPPLCRPGTAWRASSARLARWRRSITRHRRDLRASSTWSLGTDRPVPRGDPELGRGRDARGSDPARGRSRGGALGIARQVADALDVAHERRHRPPRPQGRQHQDHA